jgi:beta-lactamase regulating signal transducer with metallopeptidase domain
MLAQHAFAWLLTYLLHSTLLLGLAWLASKPLARWSVAAEEAVWKIALIGALLTASLQFAAGWEPAAGRWRLAQAPQTLPATVEAMATPVIREAAPRAMPFRFAPPTVPAPAPVAVREAPAPAALSFHLSVPSMILGLWALGAAVLLGAYGRSYLKIQRRLRTRPRVVGGHVLTQLRDLSIEAGLDHPVRLSCSSRVPVPLALGLREPEICLPPRALAGLTEEQQQGMLAHELAHLVRRDPVWLVICHVLSGVLFFQPLNWVARRRLREISEMLSDEWAVGFTGRPLSLAGCLAEVAGWSVGVRPLPMPGMADRPSSLARRIRRLLDETRSPEHPARRVWLGAAMVALLIVVAAAAPAISAARPQKPAAPKPPKTAHAAPRAAEAAKDAADQADDSWLDARPEHDKSEHAEMAEEDAADDPDVDIDVDIHHEDLDAMAEGAVSSVDEALDGMSDQLASLQDAGLTPEQQRKLEAEIDRTTRKIQETLQPRMEQLSREMSQKMSRMHETDAEMQRLQQEMAKLAAQMRPSDEELGKLRAEAEKLREEGDGALTREQRDQLRQQARHLREAARPTEEQRRQMEALREDLQKRHEEMSRELRKEHQAEIEKAQAEMRDEIEREMNAARQELRRSMDQRRQIERQERRERLERRERDRDRDHDQDHKRDKEESGKDKPPKMVLQLDMWGNFRLVPETPGC